MEEEQYEDTKEEEINLKSEYNNAKLWQLAFFSLNNAATNLYLALMGYVSYYANGIVGLGVFVLSIILTSMRIFDGLTDPIIGFLLDKTESRYGKFRPFLAIGNLLLACSCIVLFFTNYLVPKGFRLPYFIVVYGFYVIGYTFQTVVAKSGQTIITNNPRQRPLATYFDSMFIMAAYGGTSLYVSNYLIPKYKDFLNPQLFQEFVLVIAGISMVCTGLAIIGIWEKDQKKFYGFSNGKKKKVRKKDYVEILLHNKPIRMLTIASASNQFVAMVYGHTTVSVMLYGIMMKDYSICGLIGIVTALPTLLVVTIGIRIAQRFGQRRALMIATFFAIVFQVIMILVLYFGNITEITFKISGLNAITIIFVFIFTMLNGCKSIINNMVVPMIADCCDYEMVRSGKYVPGLMGALFSFIEKAVSAFGTAFVGGILTFIGFGKVLPQVSDVVTPTIVKTTLFLYCVVPIIGWLITLIAMYFYELDKTKMIEIHKKNMGKN
ncbi:MAG: MFS transporter [Lachnospiraceae bacterium]|nr:MFS transporter [Lachnospiraceae bacterium]